MRMNDVSYGLSAKLKQEKKNIEQNKNKPQEFIN